MPYSREITAEKIAGEPWGAAFLRELDLVIAANTMDSLATRETLYNTVLEARVTEFCSPLDGGLRTNQLGVVHVEPVPDAPYQAVPNATAFLREMPRGAWAVFEYEGKFDAYMADGYGGVGTQSGHKFLYTRPTAPNLCFEVLYGSVLSGVVYDRRKEIEAEIYRESFARHHLVKGTTVRDQYLNSKRWDRLIFEGPREGDPTQSLVRATRRGVKASLFVMGQPAIVNLFGVPHVLPPAFEDPLNGSRLRTLHERRIVEANNALEAHFAAHPVEDMCPFSKPGYWLAEGDTLRCAVRLQDDPVETSAGKFHVVFAEGEDRVLGEEMEWADRPALPAARR